MRSTSLAREHVQTIASLLPEGASVLVDDVAIESALVGLRPDLVVTSEPARGPGFDAAVVTGREAATAAAAARRLHESGLLFLLGRPASGLDHVKSALIDHGHQGAARRSRGAHLWWGGHSEPEREDPAAPMPLVVSFYTRDTAYEEEAAGLAESCGRQGLECEISALEQQGTWEANCALKARFMLEKWREHAAGRGESGRGLLWLDADARVRASPTLLAGCRADFAIHRFTGWQFGSGTLYFGPGERAGRLLEAWTRRCEAEPNVWDQIHLDLAWDEVVREAPLRTLWLPEPYLKIAGHPLASEAPPVIEHLQASRRLKRAVSGGARARGFEVDERVRAARLAVRPLPGPCPARAEEVLTYEPEAAAA